MVAPLIGRLLGGLGKLGRAAGTAAKQAIKTKLITQVFGEDQARAANLADAIRASNGTLGTSKFSGSSVSRLISSVTSSTEDGRAGSGKTSSSLDEALDQARSMIVGEIKGFTDAMPEAFAGLNASLEKSESAFLEYLKDEEKKEGKEAQAPPGEVAGVPQEGKKEEDFLDKLIKLELIRKLGPMMTAGFMGSMIADKYVAKKIVFRGSTIRFTGKISSESSGSSESGSDTPSSEAAPAERAYSVNPVEQQGAGATEEAASPAPTPEAPSEQAAPPPAVPSEEKAAPAPEAPPEEQKAPPVPEKKTEEAPTEPKPVKVSPQETPTGEPAKEKPLGEAMSPDEARDFWKDRNPGGGRLYDEEGKPMVDPRILHASAEGVKHWEAKNPDYRVQILGRGSGKRGEGGGHNHGPGRALDFAIVEKKTGKTLTNYPGYDKTKGFKGKVGENANIYQGLIEDIIVSGEGLYPGYQKKARSGGYFHSDNPMDTMHHDLTKSQVGGNGGDIYSGFSDEQMKRWGISRRGGLGSPEEVTRRAKERYRPVAQAPVAQASPQPPPVQEPKAAKTAPPPPRKSDRVIVERKQKDDVVEKKNDAYVGTGTSEKSKGKGDRVSFAEYLGVENQEE